MHSQAAVQDVDAETHFWVRPSPKLVCSVRQAIPAIRVRGTGISVQGPALRAVPCPPERTGCAHSQLPRRLAHTCTVSQAFVRTQGPGGQAPQPAGPSGQLGKEQTRANAEDLFSQHGVEFGQPDSTLHPGTCSVDAELLQDLIRQDGGSTETLSEAPGAYGCSCGDSPARSAPYETTSALALWPNPEVGVETRHSPGSDYTGLGTSAPVACRNSPATSWSLRAIHIPGVFNRAADELSRAALPGEWRLHPQVVQLIGDGSELLRSTCLHLQKPPTARSSTP